MASGPCSGIKASPTRTRRSDAARCRAISTGSIWNNSSATRAARSVGTPRGSSHRRATTCRATRPRPDIRAAQKSLWDAGIALEGPDTDALKGELREQNGQGVHFSGKGLREHAARWAEKVSPWLEAQLSTAGIREDGRRWRYVAQPPSAVRTVCTAEGGCATHQSETDGPPGRVTPNFRQPIPTAAPPSSWD